MSLRRSSMIAAMLLALSACGGGGGGDDDDGGGAGPDDDASGVGLWFGTFRVDGQTNSFPMRGVVTEEGDFALFTLSNNGVRLFFGTGTTNGNSFNANAVTYLHGVRSVPASMQGTVLDGVSLNGSYAFTGESATYTLLYQNLYVRPASLAVLQGVYSMNTPQGATSVAIDASGNITVNYSFPAGCTYTGTVTIPHANRNYYRSSGTYTTCGEANGPASALLYLEDASGQNNQLVMIEQHTAQNFGVLIVAAK